MPQMKLVEEVRIHVEEIQRRRVRQTNDFHVAEKQEQVVQLGRLQPHLALVAAVSHPVHEVAQVGSEGHAVDRIRAGRIGLVEWVESVEWVEWEVFAHY